MRISFKSKIAVSLYDVPCVLIIKYSGDGMQGGKFGYVRKTLCVRIILRHFGINSEESHKFKNSSYIWKHSKAVQKTDVWRCLRI